LQKVRHPEEPGDPAVSFLSASVAVADGTGFWFDAKDLQAYDGLAEQLVDAVANCLRAIGANCLLTTVRMERLREAAPPAGPYRLPSFRDDFPLPSSAEEVDRSAPGHISFVSKEMVSDLLAFLILALRELGYPVGAVFEQDGPPPEWPSVALHLIVLPIQTDG